VSLLNDVLRTAGFFSEERASVFVVNKHVKGERAAQSDQAVSLLRRFMRKSLRRQIRFHCRQIVSWNVFKQLDVGHVDDGLDLLLQGLII